MASYVLCRRMYSQNALKTVIEAAAVIIRGPLLQRRLTAFQAAMADYQSMKAKESSRGLFHIPNESTDRPADIPDWDDAFYMKEQSQEPSLPCSLPPSNPNRQPDASLYLVCRVEGQEQWMLPFEQVKQEGTALHELALSAARNTLGPDAQLDASGRAPMACCPREDKTTFFFPLYIRPPHAIPVVSAPTMEYAWMTREELSSILSPDMFAALCPALLD